MHEFWPTWLPVDQWFPEAAPWIELALSAPWGGIVLIAAFLLIAFADDILGLNDHPRTTPGGSRSGSGNTEPGG